MDLQLDLSKPILNVRINFAEGREGIIQVFPHSDVTRLAREFVRAHRLLPSMQHFIELRISEELDRLYSHPRSKSTTRRDNPLENDQLKKFKAKRNPSRDKLDSRVKKKPLTSRQNSEQPKIERIFALIAGGAETLHPKTFKPEAIST
jgi:hypothetical protein